MKIKGLLEKKNFNEVAPGSFFFSSFANGVNFYGIKIAIEGNDEPSDMFISLGGNINGEPNAPIYRTKQALGQYDVLDLTGIVQLALSVSLDNVHDVRTTSLKGQYGSIVQKDDRLYLLCHISGISPYAVDIQNGVLIDTSLSSGYLFDKWEIQIAGSKHLNNSIIQYSKEKGLIFPTNAIYNMT